MEAISSYALSYLLNALWQAPLVVAAAWLAQTLARRLRMSERHWLWTAGVRRFSLRRRLGSWWL